MDIIIIGCLLFGVSVWMHLSADGGRHVDTSGCSPEWRAELDWWVRDN